MKAENNSKKTLANELISFSNKVEKGALLGALLHASFNPSFFAFQSVVDFTSGAGGSRTPVQTSNACSVLHAQSTIDFRPGADRGRPTLDLALESFATGSRRPFR